MQDGLLAVGLVGFLPSSVIWSSQLLKETLILALTLWAVDSLISLLDDWSGQSELTWGQALRVC